MPSVITTAGETAIAQKQAASEDLEITTLKFFNVDVGGDNPTTPGKDDTEPDAQYLVETASLTAAGFINPNQVVYSILLDTSKGDYTFTWIGWYTAEGVLFAIMHTTPQYKRKTTGQQTGNNFTRNLLIPYTGIAEVTGITVPAETWQLDFTERFLTNEEERRKSNRAMYGRFVAMNDAFKVSAIPPNTEDDCEALTGWTLSGGSGSIVTDDTDYYEGSNSLKASGQVEDAEMIKDVSTAPRDWSLKNGLIAAIKGDSATNMAFFIEDGSANRNKWNLVNQTAWTVHEMKLDAPDVDGSCDYSDVCKFGIEGLDSGVIYNVDAIKTCRFNDFNIEAGEAFLEGIRLEEEATTYQNHKQDYNDDGTEVDALAPPGTGTRKDFVYLDVHMQGNFSTIAPHIAVVVSNQAQADYEDGYGYQHYVQVVALIERTTSEQITASMAGDYRQGQSVDDYGVLGKILTNEALKPHSIPEYAYPFIDGIDGDKDDFAALTWTNGIPRDSEGKIRFWTTIRGRKPIIAPIGGHAGEDRFDCDSAQLIEDEFGPNDEPIYSIDGRDNIRIIGEFEHRNMQHGNMIYFVTSADYKVEVVGYFTDMYLSGLTDVGENNFSYSINGGSSSTLDLSTGVVTPLLGRYHDGTASKLPTSISTTLGLNTVSLTRNGAFHWYNFFIELGIDSDKVTIPAQSCIADGKKWDIAHDNSLPHKPDVWAENYGKVGYDGQYDKGLDAWGIGENVKTSVSDHDADNTQYSGDKLNVFDWVLDSTETKAYQVLNPFKVSGIHQAENGGTQVNWSTGLDYVALPASGQDVTAGVLYYYASGTKLYKCIKSSTLTYATQNDIETSGLFASRIPTNGYRTAFINHNLINTGLGRNFVRATRWLPPAARSIKDAAVDERNSGQQRPVFEAGDVDFDGQEQCGVIHWRQFGNGDKNGASATGFDTLSTSPLDKAFVLDDGLTALVGDNVYTSWGTDLRPSATNDYHIFTGFFTGLRAKSKGTASLGNICSSLPLGTGVVKQLVNADNSTGVAINNVDLGDFGTNNYGTLYEYYLYQPKLPDLPTGAHVLNEYMGMADAVSPTEAGNLVIGKGVRRVHATRDVFYDQSASGGTDWNIPVINTNRIGGFHVQSGGAVKDNYVKLPFFGECVDYKCTEGSSTASYKFYIDGTLLTDTNFPNAVVYALSGSWNSSTGVWTPSGSTYYGSGIVVGGLTKEFHVLEAEITTGASTWANCSALDLYPGIHRSNHNTKLTNNPHVSPELVGGGDGICNDNLIVSADGQTLEKLRRPDAVEWPDVQWLVGKNDGNMAANGTVKWNITRGTYDAHNAKVRGCIYIPATGEALMLKDGSIRISAVASNVDQSGAGYFILYTYKNGHLADRKFFYSSNLSGEYGSSDPSVTMDVKKGDLIKVDFATAGPDLDASGGLKYCNFGGISNTNL